MKFVKYTLFPVIVGIVVGMLIAFLTKDVKYLSWLAFGLDFGMPSPLVLNLNVINVTFGMSVNLNVATIICIVLSLVIAQKLCRKYR